VIKSSISACGRHIPSSGDRFTNSLVLGIDGAGRDAGVAEAASSQAPIGIRRFAFGRQCCPRRIFGWLASAVVATAAFTISTIPGFFWQTGFSTWSAGAVDCRARFCSPRTVLPDIEATVAAQMVDAGGGCVRLAIRCGLLLLGGGGRAVAALPTAYGWTVARVGRSIPGGEWSIGAGLTRLSVLSRMAAVARLVAAPGMVLWRAACGLWGPRRQRW